MNEPSDQPTTVSLLAIDRDDIPAVLTALENGQTVRAKIAVGNRRATPAVLDHLEDKLQQLGAHYTHEPANDINPGDRWRRIEPPPGTGRDRTPTQA